MRVNGCMCLRFVLLIAAVGCSMCGACAHVSRNNSHGADKRQHVFLLVDTTRSMSGPLSDQESRIARVQAALASYVGRLGTNTCVHIATFDEGIKWLGTYELAEPNRRRGVSSVVAKITPDGRGCFLWRSMAELLAEAESRVLPNEVARVLVFTDGRDNETEGVSLEEFGRRLKKVRANMKQRLESITIYMLGIGFNARERSVIDRHGLQVVRIKDSNEPILNVLR